MSLIDDVRAGLYKLDQSDAALKKFCALLAGCLVAIGAFAYFMGSHPERTLWLFLLAGLLLLAGMAFPGATRPLHKIWMGLALVLGWFTSRIILTVIFVLILSPVALVLRLLKNDPLDRRIEPDRQSYWIKRENRHKIPDSYDRLF